MSRRRKNRKRSKRPKNKFGQEPVSPVTSLETKGSQGEGAGVVDLAQPRLRSKIRDVEDYIKGNAFTDEQTRKMLLKMGTIVEQDDSGRYAIGAYRVILARAKLAHDIERGQQQQPTNINIDARTDGGGTSVFAIAASLGLQIDIERDGEVERHRDIIEGSARRSQPEE